jgi:putative transposase
VCSLALHVVWCPNYLSRLAKVLWSPPYFAAVVGYVSESTVRRYTGHRWEVVAL